jgi:hypothetical protein
MSRPTIQPLVGVLMASFPVPIDLFGIFSVLQYGTEDVVPCGCTVMCCFVPWILAEVVQRRKDGSLQFCGAMFSAFNRRLPFLGLLFHPSRPGERWYGQRVVAQSEFFEI